MPISREFTTLLGEILIGLKSHTISSDIICGPDGCASVSDPNIGLIVGATIGSILVLCIIGYVVGALVFFEKDWKWPIRPCIGSDNGKPAKSTSPVELDSIPRKAP